MTTNAHLSRNLVGLYVPQEQEFLPALEDTLRVLGEKGLLTTWQMCNVLEHDATMPEADILLLLVSPSFVQSSFFLQAKEVLLQKHEAGAICVVPLLLRYTLWYDQDLSKLATLPPNAGRGHKPLADWRNRNNALERIGQGLLSIVVAFEQEQITRMSGWLQDVLTAVGQQRLQELLTHGLPEQLFAVCERLEPLIPDEHIAVLFEELAEATKDDQSDFAERCAEKAAAIRQQQNGPSSH